MTGVPVPATVESRGLLPMLADSAADAGRDSVHAVYRDVQRMVSDGNWKLIEYSRSESRAVGVDRLQLFDLQSDPCEITDRSADAECRSTLEELRSDLRAWQRAVRDPLVRA
jgi:arylsulfatase A-like enzyme